MRFPITALAAILCVLASGLSASEAAVSASAACGSTARAPGDAAWAEAVASAAAGAGQNLVVACPIYLAAPAAAANAVPASINLVFEAGGRLDIPARTIRSVKIVDPGRDYATRPKVAAATGDAQFGQTSLGLVEVTVTDPGECGYANKEILTGTSASGGRQASYQIRIYADQAGCIIEAEVSSAGSYRNPDPIKVDVQDGGQGSDLWNVQKPAPARRARFHLSFGVVGVIIGQSGTYDQDVPDLVISGGTFVAGGKERPAIARAVGESLTIDGPIVAPERQVFGITGAVGGTLGNVNEVPCAWWGADPTDTADATGPLNACLAASAGALLPRGIFRLTDMLSSSFVDAHIHGAGRAGTVLHWASPPASAARPGLFYYNNNTRGVFTGVGLTLSDVGLRADQDGSQSYPCLLTVASSMRNNIHDIAFTGGNDGFCAVGSPGVSDLQNINAGATGRNIYIPNSASMFNMRQINCRPFEKNDEALMATRGVCFAIGSAPVQIAQSNCLIWTCMDFFGTPALSDRGTFVRAQITDLRTDTGDKFDLVLDGGGSVVITGGNFQQNRTKQTFIVREGRLVINGINTLRTGGNLLHPFIQMLGASSKSAVLFANTILDWTNSGQGRPNILQPLIYTDAASAGSVTLADLDILFPDNGPSGPLFDVHGSGPVNTRNVRLGARMQEDFTSRK